MRLSGVACRPSQPRKKIEDGCGAEVGYPSPMRPQDLTPAELAELLHRAYPQDLGEDVDEVDMDTRQRLADYLGCHEETRAAAWDAWSDLLDDAPEIDPDAAEYWLDVEFVEPCPGR